MNKNSLAKYCDEVESHMKSMYSALDKLERDMISEINNVQQAVVQNSNITLNYISALITSALSAVQKYSAAYFSKYTNMIDEAKKQYVEFMNENKEDE